VAEVVKAADFLRGAFNAHFDSKEKLQAAAVARPGLVPRSPSAVSEARMNRRMMRRQAAPARFRYSDLKEAARGCGGRGPYGD
jgi:AcrR family transcriptional regulator